MDLLDRLLQPGKSIRLKFSGDDGLKRSVHAYIIRSLHANQLTLLFKDNDTSIYHIEPGTKLKINSQDEIDGHDYRLLTELIEVKPGELPRIVVKRPTEIDHSSRRSSIRLDVNLPISYFENLKERSGEVRNLSISGLLALVKSSTALKVNHSLTFKITLPGSGQPLIIIGKINRVEREDDLHSWVALDFQNSSEEIKSKISRYLVQRERLLININKRKKEQLIETF